MKKKYIFIFSCLCVLLLLAFLFGLSMGSYSIGPSEILSTLFGNGSKMQNIAIFNIRLPRICVAIAVGFALSCSGSILQTITKNDLAEPGIIGINAGAAFAVVVLISYGGANYYSVLGNLALFLMPFVAITGALLAAFLIYGLSYRRGISPVRLILVGIGVNAGVNAFVTLYQLNMSKGDYNQALTWISGSLWGSSWKYFYLIAPIVLVFFGLTLYKNRILDVMDLGDEIATGLGVNVEKEQSWLLFYAVVLAAVATAVAGNIAFLGLLGPHIAKQLVGPVHRRKIPIAGLISAIIIVVADTVSKNLFSPLEIPVGITISILGVPYFIYLMMRTKQ